MRSLLILAAGMACLVSAGTAHAAGAPLEEHTPPAIVVEAPDPATPFLVGTGLVAVSLATRRLRKKRKS